jgi:tRNA threonylcarbamoyladenosine biosynthesis protein TsaB
MIVLCFDTATPDTVVALGRGAGGGSPGQFPIERRHTPGVGERPGHASQLLALCGEALRQAELRFGDVERIGVGVGPGTFTGLRIGVATARALAQSCGAQLVAVSTLQALAAGAAADGPVLACLDARRGEAFTAGWHDGAAVHPAAATRPEDLAELVGEGWLVVGDGALRFRAQLEAAGAVVPGAEDPRHHVGGAALHALALAAEPVGRDALVPEYVRAPDAQERPR